jgi:hypothetical protein
MIAHPFQATFDFLARVSLPKLIRLIRRQAVESKQNALRSG